MIENPVLGREVDQEKEKKGKSCQFKPGKWLVKRLIVVLFSFLAIEL